MEKEQEIKGLRSKDVCEQQLAVELAVGAIDNIDSLIEQGHEVACEYACQLLFDNLRLKVAECTNLPAKIVNHLINDRNNNIRLKVIETNWETLTEEQQQKVMSELKLLCAPETEKEKEQHNSRYTSKYHVNKNAGHTLHYAARKIIEPLLDAALLLRDESAVLDYLKIVGIPERLFLSNNYDTELIPTLKAMPKVFHVYWNGVDPWHRTVDVILAHPDESVRMIEIQRILHKDTRTYDLRKWREVVGRGRRGKSLKTKILELWTTDPSETIRQLIAANTTDVDILETLSMDASNIVSRIASPRYKKFKKRYEYSQAYNTRKRGY